VLRLSIVISVTAAALNAAPLHAGVVSDGYIDAVAQLESSGGRWTIGDGGRANGTWQMHAAAWRDTTEYRKRKGLPVWDYSHAHERVASRQYVRDYLAILENQLRSALRRPPTPQELYAAYNVGFTKFESVGFSVRNTPRTTREACAKLSRLLENRRAPDSSTTKLASR
jgi:hypothetical protein